MGASVVTGGTWGGDALDNAAAIEARPSHFGETRQLVISNDCGASVSYVSYQGTDAHRTSVVVAPAIDYFLVDHVSAGVAASVRYSNSTGTDYITGAVVSARRTTYGGGPRTGVDVPLGTTVSLYPKVGIAISGGSYESSSLSATRSQSESIVSVSLYVPVLLHPTPHVFFGFGPSLYRELKHRTEFVAAIGSNEETTLGASFVIGGWR